MKLSIIVPVFNGEKDIKECLMSLIRQSTKVKIILVDDGSIDNTALIVKELKDKYPKLIEYYYQENEGISSARNFGLSKVNTEYFGFLDSDDVVREDMAKEMLEKIENDNSDICIADFNWVYSDSIKYQKDTDYKDKKDLLVNMYATLWNKIYRTSFIKDLNIRFPLNLKYEDASFLYRLAPHLDKVSYINKAYVDYRQIGGSITHSFNYDVLNMIDVFKGIVAYYKSQNVYEEYKEELEYLHIRFFLGNSYLRAIRINDKNIRKEVLDKSWTYLNETFPDFKRNKYLKNSSKKNIYYRYINKTLYYFNSHIFRLLYKLKIMK